MSINWQSDVDPAPAILVLPPAAVSLDEAHAAIELWEFYKRRTLDATQRLVVEVMMATRADGLWAAPTTGREMPRQNGKGDEIEVVELWGLTQRAERILHTVHDAVLLATETQSRLLSVIEGHADLRRLKYRAWKGTGQQMIEMRNGGIVWYRTRTGGGARGVDEVDRIVVDEAQHAEEEHLAALTPTQLASVNPQLNALGTGGILGKSRWWWGLRKRALGRDPGNLGYVGHTAERIRLDAAGKVQREPLDVSTPSLFRAALPPANPALGRRPDLWEFFDEQYRTLGPALASREHLGVWDPEPGDGAGGAINMDTWRSLAQVSVIESHRMWALEVADDRSWASLGVAGRRADGRAHVEWMEHRSGTHWVVDRVVEGWAAKRIPIRIASGTSSRAAAFIPLLREKGVEVVEVPPAEVTAGVGQLIDAVNAGQLVHLGQPSLDKCVGVAALATTGHWVSVDPSVEITPLKAVTVALGGVPQTTAAYAGSFSDLEDFLPADEEV